MGIVLTVGLESRLNPRNIGPELYNKIKNSVNRLLRNTFSWSSSRYFSMGMSKQNLSGDGIHPNIDASKNLMDKFIQDAKGTLRVDSC